MKKVFLKKIGATMLALMMALGLVSMPVLAAQDEEPVALEPGYDYTRFQGQDITLNVYNWGLYISDGADDTLDVIAQFEALTGIDVNYTTFASNEDMHTKISMGGAEYDIVIPSDYMVGRMIEEGLLAQLNYDNIPNISFISEEHLGWAYDPQGTYSVPYMWGTTGLIYNTTMVQGTPDSWDLLWNEDYAGQITMFNNSRDAFAIALARLGLPLNPTTQEEINAARELLQQQKVVAPLYLMDEIFDKLEGGEAAAGPYYAGDAITMMEENPDLAFVFPKEGVNYFVDAMCVLQSSRNKEAAEMFINFMCETEVALANALAIGYSTPHTAAYELLPEEVRTSEIAYPSSEILDRSQVFTVLPQEMNEAMDAAWSEVRSYDEAGNKWLMPALLIGLVGVAVFVVVQRANRKKRDDY
ncbi:spermidine/putrescine ABC transporter substrate-binding protein [Ruminococcaceae bacterium OttesenSCG-928-N02]|nr:spermidine/putrescine ABC transporter substrate-binding protein [Ruminococcaceae bacterium OttesenSCG-928-N02]